MQIKNPYCPSRNDSEWAGVIVAGHTNKRRAQFFAQMFPRIIEAGILGEAEIAEIFIGGTERLYSKFVPVKH